MSEVTYKKVDDYLNEIDYGDIEDYIPSSFAIEFVNFIKLVENGNPENKTPVVHYRMIDQFVGTLNEDGEEDDRDTLNMCHRGIAKSTLKEYLLLYIAVFESLPNFGKVPYALYVSDSIENGVKKMRKSLEYRWENSVFLQKYIPTIRFTDVRWEFKNIDGGVFIVSGYGAKTGVRGTRENGTRPVLALLDDLISDSDARSDIVISDVEDTIYKAIDYALHPQRRKIIWSGTPFNARDPLYKAVESGAWKVNVYPICEHFPCTREEFKGSWEDRFSYDYVNKQYTKALRLGKTDTFMQELMLRIMSEEDRLVPDTDIQWYRRGSVLENKLKFNFYITTDFATNDKEHNDFSVISVWAYSCNGDWFWVDGVCRKQTMDKNIKDLFKYAQRYKPLEVGIEVSGQQQGFVSWLKEEMITKNHWFNLASDQNGKLPGIRPKNNKLDRFNIVQPFFSNHKMFFPQELRESPEMVECMDELKLLSQAGFKSKHDDFADTISMLGSLRPWRPAEDTVMRRAEESDTWEADEWDDDDTDGGYDSYVV